MALKVFPDSIRLSEVYKFEGCSNQNKIDGIVNNDWEADCILALS